MKQAKARRAEHWDNESNHPAVETGPNIKAGEGSSSDLFSGHLSDRPDPKVYEMVIYHPETPLQDTVLLIAMLSGPAATVLVGPGHVAFTIPMSLLFNHSNYVEKALNGPFREASGNIVQLPDTEPEVFFHFVIYMYQRELRISEHWSQDRPYEELTAGCLLLWQLYVLVDFLQCRYWPDIQDKVSHDLKWATGLAALMGKETPILPNIVLEVLRTTGADCPLRQIVYQELRAEFSKSSLSCGRRPIKAYAQCMQKFPDEFSDEILERLQRESSRGVS